MRARMSETDWRQQKRWKTSPAKRLYEEAERARESEARLLEALDVAEEHLSTCVPSDGWGLRDKGADADRKEALAQVRAAIDAARAGP